MAFTDEQRGVLRGAAAGLAMTLGALGAALALPPMQVVALGQIHSRLALWSEWAVLAILPLILLIGALARHRFRSPGDIGGSGLSPGGEHARMLQAMVQNTLEQTVLWAGVTLVWAVRMPVGTLGVIPVSVVLFLLGRALFVGRYHLGAGARASGFALTFYPSVGMAVLLLLERMGLPFE